MERFSAADRPKPPLAFPVEPNSVATFEYLQQQRESVELSELDEKILTFQSRVDLLSTYIETASVSLSASFEDAPPVPDISSIGWDQRDYTRERHALEALYKINNALYVKEWAMIKQLQTIMARMEKDPVAHEAELAEVIQVIAEYMYRTTPVVKEFVAKKNAFRRAERRYCERLLSRHGFATQEALEEKQAELREERRQLRRAHKTRKFSALIPLGLSSSRVREIEHELQRLKHVSEVVTSVKTESSTDHYDLGSRTTWKKMRELIHDGLRASLAQEVATVSREILPLAELPRSTMPPEVRSELEVEFESKLPDIMPQDAGDEHIKHGREVFSNFMKGSDIPRPTTSHYYERTGINKRMFGPLRYTPNGMTVKGNEVFDALATLAKYDDLEEVILEITRERLQETEDTLVGEGVPRPESLGVRFSNRPYEPTMQRRRESALWQSALFLQPLQLVLHSESARATLGETGIARLRENASRIIHEAVTSELRTDSRDYPEHHITDVNFGELFLTMPDTATAQLFLNIAVTDRSHMGDLYRCTPPELVQVMDMVSHPLLHTSLLGQKILSYLRWEPEANLESLRKGLSTQSPPDVRRRMLISALGYYSNKGDTPVSVLETIYPYLPLVVLEQNQLDKIGRELPNQMIARCIKVARTNPAFRERFWATLTSSADLRAAIFKVAVIEPDNIVELYKAGVGRIDMIEEYRKYTEATKKITLDQQAFQDGHLAVFSQMDIWKSSVSNFEFFTEAALHISRHPELLVEFQHFTQIAHDIMASTKYGTYDTMTRQNILRIYMKERFLKHTSAAEVAEDREIVVKILEGKRLEVDDLQSFLWFIPFLPSVQEYYVSKILTDNVLEVATMNPEFHKFLFQNMSEELGRLLYDNQVLLKPTASMPLYMGPEKWKQEAAKALLGQLRRSYHTDASLEQYYPALCAYRKYEQAIASLPATRAEIAGRETAIVRKLIEKPELEKEYLRIGEELAPILPDDTFGGMVVKCAIIDGFQAIDDPAILHAGIDGLKRFVPLVIASRSSPESLKQDQETFERYQNLYQDRSTIAFVIHNPDKIDLVFSVGEKAPLLLMESYTGTRSFAFEHGSAILQTEADLEFVNTLVGKYSKAADQIIRDYVVCVEQGVITPGNKLEVLEFLERFRILTPNIIKQYLEARVSGTTEIFLTTLRTMADKMASGQGMSATERQSPYYEELLQAIYPNNAGTYGGHEKSKPCADRSADLAAYSIKPRYDIDLLSGGSIQLKQGEVVDVEGIERLKNKVLSVARKFEQDGYESEKMQTRVRAEIDEAFEKRAAKGAWAGVELAAVTKPEEKLFLLLSDRIYGQHGIKESALKELLISYQFAYLEDIRAYIQGTADRVSASNSPEYAMLCELDNFFADKIKEVNRTIVQTAWQNPVIAAQMRQYFTNHNTAILTKERSQRLNQLRPERLGLNEGFLKQVKRILEGKTGKKYNLGQVTYIIKRYEDITKGLTVDREGPYAVRTGDQYNRSRAFRGQLESQREKTMAAVTLLTGRKLAPEDVHLGEIDLGQWLNTEGNMAGGQYNEEQFGTYTTQQIINMFSAERGLIEEEIDKFESESGTTRTILNAYITKTKESAHARQVGGVCVAKDNPPATNNMWDQPNYFQMVFQDPKTSRCQGLSLIHTFEGDDTEDGERVLSIAVNPSSTYLFSVDEAALFKGILDATIDFARQNRFDKIVISRHQNIRTNRTGGLFEKAMNAAIARVGKQYKFKEPKRFSFNPGYMLDEMDVLWERPAAPVAESAK